MFSYNSFNNGNDTLEDENGYADIYENPLLPAISDNPPLTYNQACPYANDGDCVFTDYEPVFHHELPMEPDEIFYAQREPLPRPREEMQRPRQPFGRARLSNNPATPQIVLFKELDAIQRYGNPSGNADILYTGNRGNWTFTMPSQLYNITRRSSGVLQLSMVLDDHVNVRARNYSANIYFNGVLLHQGPLRIQHGTPLGGPFTNWTVLSFDIRNIRRNNTVMIENTSNVGMNDWIGIDWMQLVLTQT